MELKFILEAVLFSAQKPLSPAELRAVLAEAAEHAARAIATGARSRSAKLPARLRGWLLAVRQPAGICALAQGPGRRKDSPAAFVSSGARNAGHYRLPPAADPRSNRTSPRCVRGWRHADLARTRFD